MSKISPLQLFSVLFVNHIFSFICFSLVFCVESVFAFILFSIIQGAVSFGIYYIYKNGFSLEIFLKNNKLCAVFLVLLLVYMLSATFIRVRNVSEGFNFFISPLFSAIVIILVCCYTASLGIKPMARISFILLGLFTVLLAIIILGSYSRIRLSCISFDENETIASQLFYCLSFMAEPVILFLLLPFCNINKSFKHIFLYIIISLIMDIIICLLCVTVLHEKINMSDYPFFALTDVSQPFRVQRSDALYTIIFVVLGIFRISCISSLCARLLYIVFEKIQYKIPLILAISGLVSFGIYYCEFLYSGLVKIASLLLFLILCIAIIWVIRETKKEKSDKGEI